MLDARPLESPSFPPPPPPAAKPKRKWLAAAAALVVLGGVAAVVTLTRGASSPATVPLRGTFMLSSADNTQGSWDDCKGTGGYGDVKAGMLMDISDAQGTKVGGGSLRNVTPADDGWLAATDFFTNSGKTKPDPTAVRPMLAKLQGYACMLVWEIDVKPSDFYTLSIGHRGGSTESYQDLKAHNFVVQLSLGE